MGVIGKAVSHEVEGPLALVVAPTSVDDDAAMLLSR